MFKKECFMNWINIEDQNFKYIKERLTNIFSENSNLDYLSNDEFELLTDITSRTLYGMSELCRENNIEYDLENKFKVLEFYKFNFIYSFSYNINFNVP